MVKDLAVGPDISRGGLRLLAYISKNDGIMQSQLVKAFGQSTYLHTGTSGEGVHRSQEAGQKQEDNPDS
jgi:hypothetical protein